MYFNRPKRKKRSQWRSRLKKWKRSIPQILEGLEFLFLPWSEKIFKSLFVSLLVTLGTVEELLSFDRRVSYYIYSLTRKSCFFHLQFHCKKIQKLTRVPALGQTESTRKEICFEWKIWAREAGMLLTWIHIDYGNDVKFSKLCSKTNRLPLAVSLEFWTFPLEFWTLFQESFMRFLVSTILRRILIFLNSILVMIFILFTSHACIYFILNTLSFVCFL